MAVVMKGASSSQGFKLKDSLGSEAAVTDAVDVFGVSRPGGNLGQWIAKIRQATNGGHAPAALRALGAPNGELVLDAAANTLAGGSYDAGATFSTRVSGQIFHYRFFDSSSCPRVDGKRSGNGEFVVMVKVVNSKQPGGAAVIHKVDFFMWEVHVINCALVELRRDDGDSNLFPGSAIQFGPEMLQRIMDRGYQRKLQAVGRSTDGSQNIVIRNVWRAHGTDPGASAPASWGMPISDSGANARFYEVDEQSCIDMLFVGDAPEFLDDLPPPKSPPLYCLGRCQHPMMVNTGD
jgi:hypothetical protein